MSAANRACEGPNAWHALAFRLPFARGAGVVGDIHDAVVPELALARPEQLNAAGVVRGRRRGQPEADARALLLQLCESRPVHDARTEVAALFGQVRHSEPRENDVKTVDFDKPFRRTKSTIVCKENRLRSCDESRPRCFAEFGHWPSMRLDSRLDAA